MEYYVLLRELGVGITAIRKVPNRFTAVVRALKFTDDTHRVDMIAGERWDEWIGDHPECVALVRGE